MDWWGDNEDYYPSQTKACKEESKGEWEPSWDQVVCIHSWKPIVLIVSKVFDCAKCGIKKEEYEEWQKRRNPF